MFSFRVSGKLFSMLLRVILTMEVAMGIKEQSLVIVKTFVCTISSCLPRGKNGRNLWDTEFRMVGFYGVRTSWNIKIYVFFLWQKWACGSRLYTSPGYYWLNVKMKIGILWRVEEGHVSSVQWEKLQVGFYFWHCSKK